MKKFTLAAVCLLCLAGCQNDNKKAGWSKARTEMEVQAQVCLKDARAALERADYTTARAKVEEIRSQYNLALNAREEAILFMDSVDMRQATQELQRVNQLIHTQPENQDSLKAVADELSQKIKFYLRKLEHDKKNRQEH